MHEFSMTQQIVALILEEANRYHAKKVTEVHLIIGKLTFLVLEQVKFAYNLIVKNTIMEDSNLHIEETNGVVKCNTCEYTGNLTRARMLSWIPSLKDSKTADTPLKSSIYTTSILILY
jgi:hydrogenase nickel incorporation protein HypA/HybF